MTDHTHATDPADGRATVPAANSPTTGHAPKITLTATPVDGQRYRVIAKHGADTLERDTLDLDSGTARNRFVTAVLRALPDKVPDEVRQKLHADLLALADAPPGPDPAQVADPVPDDPRAAELAKMPADVRDEAETLLHESGLIDRVRHTIERAGLTGEKDLGLLLYLIGVSAQLPKTLGGIVRGPSSSGKSYAIKTVSGLFPPEVVLQASSLTPQSLYYARPGTLRHRWVVAGERSRRQDDDTADATRAMREMLADGELSKYVTMKNEAGVLESRLIRQKGPIAFVESTTLTEVFEEDQNRCLLLRTDERQEQTRRVLEAAAATFAGQAGGDVGRAVQVHHAVVRMLPRVGVVIPFARGVAEGFPHARVEARRELPHLLVLAQAVALLHFLQRKRDADGRVVATLADYELAAALAAGPLHSAAGGTPDAAQQFLAVLRARFPMNTFTTREAEQVASASRSTVNLWLHALDSARHIEQTEPSRGRKPAQWRLTNTGPVAPSTGVPSRAQVEQWLSAKTHGHEPEGHL